MWIVAASASAIVPLKTTPWATTSEAAWTVCLEVLWLIPMPLILVMTSRFLEGTELTYVVKCLVVSMAAGVVYIYIARLSKLVGMVLSVLPPFPFAWHPVLTFVVPYSVAVLCFALQRDFRVKASRDASRHI